MSKLSYSFLSIFIVISALFLSCGNDDNKEDKEKRRTATLPEARGEVGEILTVMDSAHWEGRVGDALRAELKMYIPGLPQDEAMFKVRRVDPLKLNNVLRSATNMLFVTSFDSDTRSSKYLKRMFTDQSMATIEQDPERFIFVKNDQYARGQRVMHLFAQTEDELVKRIEENGERLRRHFHELERERLVQKIRKGPKEKSLSKELNRKFDVDMVVPKGYRVALNRDDFIWFRLVETEEDRNIFLYVTEYTDESVFDEETLLEFRDEVVSKRIWGSDSATSYMITEPLMPVNQVKMQFKDRYAMEMRGVWKLINNSMGGAFITYVIVDEETNQLFYLEGFSFAPGKTKREIMREMEAVLHTFRFKEEAISN
ncbi:MAG: DUF4837 family protein [Cyclobacteriaceae bacterium]|nr:DUF4837 family protein [Cyclobacteriaceae bacterium]MCH8517049.1 DUF4837 family protein [Cyclobacteriaceae bacterium]